jgi:hypothetical protein
MSTKASIAHPVTRVALDDTVAVRPRREALARAGRRDPRSTSATTINGPCIVIPVPDKVGDVVDACGVRGSERQAALDSWDPAADRSLRKRHRS